MVTNVNTQVKIPFIVSATLWLALVAYGRLSTDSYIAAHVQSLKDNAQSVSDFMQYNWLKDRGYSSAERAQIATQRTVNYATDFVWLPLLGGFVSFMMRFRVSLQKHSSTEVQ